MPSSLALRCLIVAAACASAAGCADPAPRQQDSVDYRSDPTPVAPGPAGPRLTIQAGEGEKLNLPWFVQDAENWVNSR